MNFFKSILSEDQNPLPPTEPQTSDPQSSTPSSPAAAVAGDGGWSFGGLIKTLATQSESVIEIYRRDLKEFGSGLQKETAALREVVKDLPSEIDGVLKSTAEIISHGTDTLLAPPPSNHDPDLDSLNNKKYSWFEAQLSAIEGDINTYCEEPEDSEDFNKWKLGFVLKREENETIRGMYERVVPDLVDDEMFWFRYYYKVYKLKQQEDTRANLVKRAISVDDDEELSWDVDDDDDDDDDDNDEIREETPRVVDEKREIKPESSGEMVNGEQVLSEEKNVKDDTKGREKVSAEEKIVETGTNEKEKKLNDEKIVETGSNEKDKVLNEEKIVETGTNEKDKILNEEKIVVADTKTKGIEKVMNEEKIVEADTKGKEKVMDVEKVVEVDTKGEGVETCKDGDVTIASMEKSLGEEEDMGWDEIEDVESGDEKKVMGSPKKDDLRKRLSVAEEDEDLSWDIEDDDDEPVVKPGAK